MRARDIFLFLLGHKNSIERIAATPFAWGVGALLVLTAGVARNYDHLYFLGSVEWFVGPFGMSLFSALFIYAWIFFPLRPWIPSLRVFISLFWLTAPCAWLYAIPVEQWTDLLTATKWNVAFLAIVSIWRVALIVRSLVVLTKVHWLRCLSLVLAPAALEMMVGSFQKSLSLIGIMGGVRLPPHHQFLHEASNFTATASFWVFLAAVLVSYFFRPAPPPKPLHRPRLPLHQKAWVVALVILAIAVPVTTPVQRKVANMHRLNALVSEGKHEEAVQFAVGMSRDDFPSTHFVPPDPYERSFPGQLLVHLPPDAPEWLVDEWTESYLISLDRYFWYNFDATAWAVIRIRHPAIAAKVRKFVDQVRAGAQRERWVEEFDEADADPAEPWKLSEPALEF